VHDAATAYKAGASIKKNAAMHASRQYLVKLDFHDFFQSIKISDLLKVLSLHFADKYSPADIMIIALSVLFQPSNLNGLCLSVGSPASPMLANAVMYEFDSKVAEWAASKGVVYSRYADDLAFSTDTPGLAAEIQEFVKDTLSILSYPRLTLNEKKTAYLSKRSQRRVTGLILNNEGSVSLGRARKREISSLIHSFKLQKLDENKKGRLQGLLGFARDVEPLFVLSMDKKYGNQLLAEIFSYRVKKGLNLSEIFAEMF
jgi:RNA-directed DNA polymerase